MRNRVDHVDQSGHLVHTGSRQKASKMGLGPHGPDKNALFIPLGRSNRDVLERSQQLHGPRTMRTKQNREVIMTKQESDQ
jgi:hypothetical protein